MANGTAARSSTTRSEGLRSLVISAENYYGAPPKTIVRKLVSSRIESNPHKVVRSVAETHRLLFVLPVPTNAAGELIFVPQLPRKSARVSLARKIAESQMEASDREKRARKLAHAFHLTEVPVSMGCPNNGSHFAKIKIPWIIIGWK
jgi:excinuclease UvrABC nuclease subunit